MRSTIAFETSDGTTLRGWHYRPLQSSERAPVVVMAHGITAVKEMWLDKYAEVFSAAGLGVLVYDHRNLGESDGMPRQEVDPWAQARDTRDAITFAETLPQADPERIGLWGSSYSGGLAIIVGAIDQRVKCVAAQVPVISGSENMKRFVRPDVLAMVRLQFDADRRSRAKGGKPGVMPLVAEDPMAPSVLPTADSWKWFTETAAKRAPNWRNELTLRSVEMVNEYEPGYFIHRVSPTPLLLIVATGDLLCPLDTALEAYSRAHEPKKLVLRPGGHFDAYVEDFAATSGAAREWFVEHLLGQRG